MSQEKERKQNQGSPKKASETANKTPDNQAGAAPPIPPLFGTADSPGLPAAPPATPTAAPPAKKSPQLLLWSVLLDEGEPVQDEIRYRLQGEVHGHPNPKFSDGEFITTSALISLDVTAKKAKTRHTTYDLGDPDPSFLEYVEGIHKKLEDYTFSTEENLRKHPRRL